MSSLTQFMLVVSAVVGAYSLVAIAGQLSSIHKVLTSGRLIVREKPFFSSSNYSPQRPGPGGTAIFVYRDGQWVLDAEFSEPGYVAVPPTSPGIYEGQAIRTPSQPAAGD